MDKKEYIIRQLNRAKNKKYELYVITRIIHLLDDNNIKFVTQQYVSRPEGRALTDLYFPQFGLHIEVNESHHLDPKNIELDKIREADIINATGHEILEIDVTEPLEVINEEIRKIVKKIKEYKINNDLFIPWDIEKEFNTKTYIKLGYIDVFDNVAFKTIKDACNCFGHDYIGYQKGGANYLRDENTILWFPKLFLNGEWNNKISEDEETIFEKHMDEKKAHNYVLMQLAQSKDKRIVFAKVKGNLGDILYRFRGLYQLDRKESNPVKGLVWKRINKRVETFSSKNI